MSLVTFQTELNLRRKLPRVFQMPEDVSRTQLNGVLLQWPDRSFSPIYDLSLAGVVASTQDRLSRIKVGQSLDCKLRFANSNDPVNIKLRVVKFNSTQVSMIMDSISSLGRLQVEQVVKEDLIRNNLQVLNGSSFSILGLQSQNWIHGPFDTNLCLIQGPDQGFLVEYEGTTVVYLNGQFQIFKTSSAFEEGLGYGAPWIKSTAQKVSLGASWIARVCGMFETQDLVRKTQVLSILKSLQSS